MMKQMLSVAVLTVAMGTVQAAQVPVVSVTSTGNIFNSPDLITDGDFALGTWWNDAPNVYWQGQEGKNGVTLTLDFGAQYTLKDIRIGHDNNDAYVVQTSVDGSQWFSLLTSLPLFLDNAAEFSGLSMIKRSSLLGEADYSNAIDFAPINARYARVYALGGDSSYAVSEVQFFGSPVPVPVPAGVLLLTPAIAVLSLRRRRG